MSIDRDRLMNANPERVARIAATIGDLIQDAPPADRVLGVAAFTKLFFERMGLAPQDVMTAAGNLIAGSEREGVRTFAALEQYLKDDF